MAEIHQDHMAADNAEMTQAKSTYVAPSLLHIGALSEKTENSFNVANDGPFSAS